MRDHPRLRRLVPNERDALDELLAWLQPRCGDRVVHAWLFGSKARGDFDDESDVDVAVLFGPDVPESDRFSRALHLIGETGSVFHRDDVSVVDLAACKPVRSCSSRATDRRRTSWSMSR